MNLEIMMLANCFLLVVMSFLNPELPCDELIAAVPLLIAVAAADAAIGLGILVVIFKHKNSVLLKHFERLAG
jgi:NADH:ubiquinone oxidoreductase subunit K